MTPARALVHAPLVHVVRVAAAEERRSRGGTPTVSIERGEHGPSLACRPVSCVGALWRSKSIKSGSNNFGVAAVEAHGVVPDIVTQDEDEVGLRRRRVRHRCCRNHRKRPHVPLGCVCGLGVKVSEN